MIRFVQITDYAIITFLPKKPIFTQEDEAYETV